MGEQVKVIVPDDDEMGVIAPSSAYGTSIVDGKKKPETKTSEKEPKRIRCYLGQNADGDTVVTKTVAGWERDDFETASARFELDSKTNRWRLEGHDNCPLPNWVRLTSTHTDKSGFPAVMRHYSTASLDAVQAQDKAGKVYGRDYVITQDKDGKATIHDGYKIVQENGKMVVKGKDGKVMPPELIKQVLTAAEYDELKRFNEIDRKGKTYSRDYTGALAGAQKWFDQFGAIGTFIGRALLGPFKLLGNLLTGDWCNLFSKDTLYDILCMGAVVGGAFGIKALTKNKKRGGNGGGGKPGTDGPTIGDSSGNTNSGTTDNSSSNTNSLTASKSDGVVAGGTSGTLASSANKNITDAMANTADVNTTGNLWYGKYGNTV